MKLHYALLATALILLLSAAGTTAAIIEVGEFDTPGDATSVFVEGDYACVADNQGGLRVIDVRNPEEPQQAAHFAAPGPCLSAAMAGDRLYIGWGAQGVRVFDVSDLENPEEISRFEAQCVASDIEIAGDYAYIADIISGLRILDVSDPENIRQAGAYETPDLAKGVCVAGDYAYVADRRSGLIVIDVSNPEEPAEAGALETPGEACGIEVADGYAYIANDAGGLRVIDVSNPAEPAEAGAFDTDGRAFGVALSGHYACIADGAAGLQLFNVSDPAEPDHIGTAGTPGTCRGAAYADDYVYIADGESGLRIIRLTPEIVVEPEEVDFGEVDVGESEERTVTISNVGHWDLVVEDVVVEGLYFGCEIEEEIIIGISESDNISVYFYPHWFGIREGILIINTDDPESEEIIIALISESSFTEQKITSSDAEDYDGFGGSVAINNSYAVIGVDEDDDNGNRSGSAYIFTIEDDEWIQQSKITASDANECDEFGKSVSINDNNIIIGAFYGDAERARNSGAAYIFSHQNDDWIEIGKLTTDDATSGDGFGHSVSINRDYAIVGAPYNDDNGNCSGSAYIFVKEGDRWLQQEKLTPSDAAQEDYFGYSVSIYGNYSIIGAHYNDDNGESSGSAYIFFREDNEWSEQSKLVANDAESFNRFGYSVCINGNFAIIGAPGGHDEDVNGSGSAYIFLREENDWNYDSKINANDPGENDFFGWSVSINGGNAIIGAKYNDDNGNNSGSAYIFSYENNIWYQKAKLIADDGSAGDHFGQSSFITSNNAIVGADGNDDDGTNSGSAYIYPLDEPQRPIINTIPNSLNFHELIIGENAELPICIINNGTINLTIYDIICNSEFFNNNFNNEICIENGDSTELIVTFEPDDIGIYQDSLLIFSNDPLNEVLILSLFGIVIPSSEILFVESWNLISLNVSPNQNFYREGEARGPNIELMMHQLRIDEDNHHVLLMKDMLGRFYLPAWGFNNIPHWNLCEGYLVKVDEDVEAVWAGEQIAADADIPLVEGWNMIAYYPTYELDASAPDFYVLSPIIDHVLIAKDGYEGFMVPEYRFSNMQPWRETQGYMVKVDQDVVLNYPEEQDEGGRLLRRVGPRNDGGRLALSDNNMSVLILNIQNSKSKTQNSELTAFNASGLQVGTTALDGEPPYGLAVWGDDESTGVKEGLSVGEAFEVKIAGADNGPSLDLEPAEFLEGKSLVYEPNGLIVVEAAAQAAVPEEYYLSAVYPNPFNSTTRINYGLPERTTAEVKVYDQTGRMVETLVNGSQEAGVYSTVWKADNLASGIYFIELKSNSVRFVRKALMVK